MTYKILLTGFEPFGEWNINPTAVAAEQLDNRTVSSGRIVGKVIPLRYHKILPVMKQLVDTEDPDAIVLSGQTSGSSIQLERTAANKVKTRTAYNCGFQSSGQVLVADGSDTLDSSLPLQNYYSQLNQLEIPVTYSDSAGTFGCNQIFYLTRYHFPVIPSGFIHVPLLPSQVNDDASYMTQDVITKALYEICDQTGQYLSSNN